MTKKNPFHNLFYTFGLQFSIVRLLKILTIFVFIVFLGGDRRNGNKIYIEKVYAATCIGIPQGECEFLIDLQNATNNGLGGSWFTTNSNEQRDPCGQGGGGARSNNTDAFLSCIGSNITEISINIPTLTLRTLPSSIQNLVQLKKLAITSSELQSPLPTSFPNTLTTMDFSFNKLDGSFPNLPPNLEKIDISSNQFAGSIPSFQSSLRYIYIGNNTFDGIIPTLPNGLIHFYAYNNQFNGIGSLPSSLTELRIQNNKIVGNFPNIQGLNLTSCNMKSNCFYYTGIQDQINMDLIMQSPCNNNIGSNPLGTCPGATITLSTSPSGAGILKINGNNYNVPLQKPIGSFNTISTIGNQNSTFLNRTKGGAFFSDQNTYGFALMEDSNIVANYNVETIPPDAGLTIGGNECILAPDTIPKSRFKLTISAYNTGINTGIQIQASYTGFTVTSISKSVGSASNCPPNLINSSQQPGEITIDSFINIQSGAKCIYDVKVNLLEPNGGINGTLIVPTDSNHTNNTVSYTLLIDVEGCVIVNNHTLKKEIFKEDCSAPLTEPVKLGDKICYKMEFDTAGSNRYRPISASNPFILRDKIPELMGLNIEYIVGGSTMSLYFNPTPNIISLLPSIRLNPGEKLSFEAVSDPIDQNFIDLHQSQGGVFSNAFCNSPRYEGPLQSGDLCAYATGQVELPPLLELEKNTLSSTSPITVKTNYNVGDTIDYYFIIRNVGSGTFNGQLNLKDGFNLGNLFNNNIEELFDANSVVQLQQLSDNSYSGSDCGSASYNLQIDSNELTTAIPITLNLGPNKFCAFKLPLKIKSDLSLPGTSATIGNTLSFQIVDQSNDRTGDVYHEVIISGKVDAKIEKVMECKDFIKGGVSDNLYVKFDIINSGSVVITGFGITDNLPAGLTFKNGQLSAINTPSQPSSCGGSVISNEGSSTSGSRTISNINLLPGEKCSYQVELSGLIWDSISNTATVTGVFPNEIDIDLGNNSNTRNGNGYCYTRINNGISKSIDGTGNCYSGSTQNIYLTVSNYGSTNLTSFSVTDNLPSGTHFVGPITPIGLGGTCGSITTSVGNNVSFDINGANIPPNESCTYTFKITSDGGSFTNIATVSDEDGADTYGDNNTSNPVHRACDLPGSLSIEKKQYICNSATSTIDECIDTPNDGTTYVGKYIKYEIIYRNDGDGPVFLPNINDTSDLTLTLLNPSAPNYIFIGLPSDLFVGSFPASSNGIIPAHSQGTIILGNNNAFILSATGKICNTAQISGSNSNPASVQDTICIKVIEPSCGNGSAVIVSVTNDAVNYHCPELDGLQFYEAKLVEYMALALPDAQIFGTGNTINGSINIAGLSQKKFQLQCVYTYGVNGETKECGGAPVELPTCPENVVESTTPLSVLTNSTNVTFTCLQVSGATTSTPSAVPTPLISPETLVSCNYGGFPTPFSDYSLSCPGSITVGIPPPEGIPDCTEKIEFTTAGDAIATCEPQPQNGSIITSHTITIPGGQTTQPINSETIIADLSTGTYTANCTVSLNGITTGCTTTATYNTGGSCTLVCVSPQILTTTCACACPPPGKPNDMQISCTPPACAAGQTTPSTCNYRDELSCSIKQNSTNCEDNINNEDPKTPKCGDLDYTPPGGGCNYGITDCTAGYTCKSDCTCEPTGQVLTGYKCKTPGDDNGTCEPCTIGDNNPDCKPRLKEQCEIDPSCKNPKCSISPIDIKVQIPPLGGIPSGLPIFTCENIGGTFGGNITKTITIQPTDGISPTNGYSSLTISNISKVGTWNINCKVGDTNCPTTITSTTTVICDSPKLNPAGNPEGTFREDEINTVTVTCDGTNNQNAEISVGTEPVVGGKIEIGVNGKKAGTYKVFCKHTSQYDPTQTATCDKEFVVQKRQFICPTELGEIIDISTLDAEGAKTIIEGNTIKVLKGTKINSATCIGKLNDSDGGAPKIGLPTDWIGGSQIIDSEKKFGCRIKNSGQTPDPECEFQVIPVIPECDLILAGDPMKLTATLKPGLEAFNITPRGNCLVKEPNNKSEAATLAGLGLIFNANLIYRAEGAYHGECFFRGGSPSNGFSCKGDGNISKIPLEECKEQLKFNGQATNNNITDVIKISEGSVKIECGGTLKVTMPEVSMQGRNEPSKIFTFNLKQEEVIAECNIGKGVCFGKFSGGKVGTGGTGELPNPYGTSNTVPNPNGTSNTQTQTGPLVGVKCTVNPIPGPIIEDAELPTNIGFVCIGGTEVTSYNTTIFKEGGGIIGSPITSPNGTVSATEAGKYKIVCKVSGEGGTNDQCETTIEIKTKEPQCKVKLEAVSKFSPPGGELKYTFDVGSLGMDISKVDLRCGLTIITDGEVRASGRSSFAVNTYLGLGLNSYKALCRVRKKGSTGARLRCDDGPIRIEPPGGDDCADNKIVITPAKKLEGNNPLRFEATSKTATVSCNGGTLINPSSPILDFSKQSSYDIVCKMPKYNCSANIKYGSGTNPPPGGTSNNPNSGGNSNGNNGGNGNGSNSGGGNSSGGFNSGNTYDLAISKQILTEFTKIGSGVLFDVTIKNEGGIGVSGVSIRDLVFGLSGIKIGKDLTGLKSYPGNINADIILAFPINLAAGEEKTYYLEGILTQSGYSNQVQVCDYNSGMDLDSDSCNGYNKNEDDDDIVGGNIFSGSIGDRIRSDTNENGIQDTGENGIANIPITLLRCGDNKIIGTGLSKTDGSYQFLGINPGSYRIQVSITGLYNLLFTKYKQGNNDIIDSDITPYTGGVGLSDCVSIIGGQNYLKLDAGLIKIPNDISVTKITSRKFVTNKDIVKRDITVKNVGSGVITNYTISDKIPGILDYKVISLSGDSSILSYCGYPISRQYNNIILTGVVGNANLKPGQSCSFTLTTQAINNPPVGLYTNTACATGVNDETLSRSGNNCGSDTIQVIKACPNLSVTPDFGDNPLLSNFKCSLSGGTSGYIQILNNKDILIKNYINLSGSHLFSGIGYYYVECVSPSFSGERCIRPVEIRELSECRNLTITNKANNIVVKQQTGTLISAGTYNFSCTGVGVTSTRIVVRQEFKTGNIIATINGSSGSATISEGGYYHVQCIINDTVDYGFDYINSLSTGINYNTTNCPYRLLNNGSLCASTPHISPHKVNFIALSEFKYSIDPIEYCPIGKEAGLTCSYTNQNKTLVKNYTTCNQLIGITQPDIQIIKTANRVYYTGGDKVQYTIQYMNTGNTTSNTIIINDILSEYLSHPSGTNLTRTLSGLAPGASGSILFTATTLKDIKLPIRNKVIANTANDKYLANNVSEVRIYPHGRNTGGNSTGIIGDRVRSDTNFNGIQNSGEVGIKNIKVELVHCSGSRSLIDTSYTDSSGYYSFSSIKTGYYKIAATLISGHVFTYGKIGIDDSIDSDIGIGDTTNCFYYDGKNNLNKDIGMYDFSSIMGTRFCNFNGTKEANLGEQCDGSDGVFGNTERCVACKIQKLFPNCGDGIIQPGEGCDCNTVLPEGNSCVNCQVVTGGVCGNGKLEGLEECETNSTSVPGLQCNNCKLIQNTMGTCGNGLLDIGEMCDLGSNNGSSIIIDQGRFAGMSCSNNCNAVDNKCRIIDTNKSTPECTQVLSPDIMEGEFLPYRRDISNENIIPGGACEPGKIPSDTVFCSFSLYAGKSGTNTALTKFTVPCIDSKTYNQPLLSKFNPASANYAGRSYLQVADRITKGIYGEYKLQLQKIDYAVCTNSGSLSQRTIERSDSVICEYNFTVSRPYLMQVGQIISSDQNDNLKNFYGFTSNNSKNNILEQYQINVNPLTLTKFKPNTSLQYLLTQFSEKVSKLATKAIEFGPKTSKVPGSEIYIYEGDTVLDYTILPNKSATIIIKNGNLTLSGSIKQSNLYIIPNGNVIFANACDKDQEIYGAVLTNGTILSDRPYNNTNLVNNRCAGGGLIIHGTLAGGGLDEFIKQRRSKLDGWFLKVDYRSKYQSIINGGSVVITPNAELNTNPPPGRTELQKTLSITK